MIEFLKSDKFILPIVYIIIGIVLQNVVRFIVNKVNNNKYFTPKLTIVVITPTIK